MKSIKPIALKEAKLLSNEEMKHLFGGSATTLTCSFTCEGGESVSASGCARCVANDNGGICYYPTGSAAALLCKSSGTDDYGTSGGTDGQRVYVCLIKTFILMVGGDYYSLLLQNNILV